MVFEILSPNYVPYATLIGITLIGGCIPFLWVRKEGFATALKKSCIATLLIAPITLGIALTINHNTFEVNGKNLSVSTAYLYKFSGSLDDFDLNNAHVGPLQSIPEAKLKWRQGGIGLPGMNAGNFSTSEDKSIFVVLTDPSSVLYLPARSGDSLLISVDNPTKVLETLKGIYSVHK